MQTIDLIADELIKFFPSNTAKNNLEQLAVHINYQMGATLSAIKIDQHTIANWEIYQAIQTLKNVKLPQAVETKEGGWKRYRSGELPFHGQEQLEHIQQFILENCNHFPTEKPQKNKNQIEPYWIGQMLFHIHIECEKINPFMTWHSGDMESHFQKLAQFIIEKMKIFVSDSTLRSYIRKISKPQRDEQKEFLAHMRRALGAGKVSMSSPEFQKALRSYQDKK